MKFDQADYPAIYRAADGASLKAQRNYLRLTKDNLMLLVGGAALAAMSGCLESAKPAVAIASAIVLAGTLIITIYLKTSKLEQIWYGGRAVAESVKSMTWRYVTGTDPYSLDLTAADADGKFVSELGSILKERIQLAFGFGGEFSQEPHISDRMREVRAMTLDERRSIYVSERILDQRKWYGAQALANRLRETKYFIAILLGQFFALVSAIALVAWPQSNLKLTGMFTSLASALIAWLQLKQHKELAQSYSVAEIELGFIQEKAQHIVSDRALSDFVGDAENAISREHTLWVARRDKS